MGWGLLKQPDNQKLSSLVVHLFKIAIALTLKLDVMLSTATCRGGDSNESWRSDAVASGERARPGRTAPLRKAKSLLSFRHEAKKELTSYWPS